MHLRHQTWPTGTRKRKKQNCILLCCQEERWFLVWKQHQCDLWNWVAARICIYRWGGGVVTHGERRKSETTGSNWGWLRGSGLTEMNISVRSLKKDMEYPREIKQVKKDMRLLSKTALYRRVWFTFICPSCALFDLSHPPYSLCSGPASSTNLLVCLHYQQQDKVLLLKQG